MNKPRTTEALKDNIGLEIADTENDVLRRTADYMQVRVQIRFAEGCGHFQHFM
jgi:hypothetical protein